MCIGAQIEAYADSARTTNRHVSMNEKQPTGLGGVHRNLVVAVVLLYVFSWAYAIAVNRHLYLDAAYHLYLIETQVGFLSFWNEFSDDFFRSRAFAVWVSQAPAIFSSDVLGISGKSLSFIYGASLVGAKLAPLLVLWKLTAPALRAYLLLPLGALWVGTASADLVIISEGHLTASLIWIPAFFVLGMLRPGAISSCVAVLSAFILMLTYESMVILGLLMVAAALLPGLRPAGSNSGTTPKLAIVSVMLMSAAASAFAFASITFPRDVGNRDGLVSSSLALLDASASGYVPAASIVMSLLFAVLLVASLFAERFGRKSRWGTPLSIGIAFVGTLAALFHLASFPVGLLAHGTYSERLFSLLVVPAAFLTLLIATRICDARNLLAGWRQDFPRVIAIPVAFAGILQVVVSLWLTTAWVRDTTQLEILIADRIGLVSCRDSLGRSMPANDSAGAMVCNWTITSLSILLFGNGAQALAYDSAATFKPIDTTTAHFRQRIARQFRLGAYFAARPLTPSDPFIFTSGDWNSPPIINGFSSPEPHGTWTDGRFARVNICSSREAPQEGMLEIRFFAFTSERLASQRVTASLGYRKSITYEASYSQGSSTVHALRIPTVPRSGTCEVLTLELPNATPPASVLPASADPRLLGIALIGISRLQ